jgi:hypothetical protein
MPTLAAPVILVLTVVGVSFMSARAEGRAIEYAIIAVAVVLLAKYSMLPWLRRTTTRYVLTTERLIVRRGVLRRSRIDSPDFLAIDARGQWVALEGSTPTSPPIPPQPDRG